MFQFSAPPALSLYVHFPWCVQKCPYCDFNSHTLKTELPEDRYIEALLKDLEYDLPSVWGRSVHSIFLGGGTPSLFSPSAIEQLLDGIRARLPLHPNAEITLEANPNSVEQSNFEGYRKAGVNRLSIGIQSLNSKHLISLGRAHNSEEAIHAVQAARAAGFDNFNLDLMFALPEQSIEEALSDLSKLIALNPTHISWYQLTIEPNTLFSAHPPTVPVDEDKWHIHEQGVALLKQHDYHQYEVSAFAKTGVQCSHNLNYWRFGDYLGIGAGAHAKITDGASNSILRCSKKKHPSDYLATAGTNECIDTVRQLGESEVVFEFALNRLRLNNGFSINDFENSCGLAREQLTSITEIAIQKGLLKYTEERFVHTEKGWHFLDDLVELFLPPGDIDA